MKKITLLTGLLIIQIILACILLFGGSKLDSHSGIQKLLNFDRTQINGLQITDGDGSTVKLTSNDSNWSTEEQFPADSIRIDRLLSQLSELEHGLAIANSAKAASRFEVGKENFQRRLQLFLDEQPVIDIYLGTGAGARRSHVRRAGDTSIYSTTIGSYDLPTTVADWQKKDLLLIETDQIHSIEFNDLKIRKQTPDSPDDTEENEKAGSSTEEPEWIAEGLAENEIFKTDTFKSLLRNFTNLRYTRAFKGSVDKKNLQAEATINYEETSRRYSFHTTAENNEFWLKVSDYEYIFVLPEYIGTQIVENLNRKKLIEIPEVESAKDAAVTVEEPILENN